MARPRQFELDDVLEKAMSVFWRRGFAATSMSDIYEATGLKPGNLYKLFKDKDDLFQRCFTLYVDRFRATLPRDVRGLAAIGTWLALQARLATEDPQRRGCLIVNTVAEREVHSSATQALAAARLAEIRDFFIQHVSFAVAAGEIAGTTDVLPTSDAMLGSVVSIMTLGRSGVDSVVIRNVASRAYASLGPDHEFMID